MELEIGGGAHKLGMGCGSPIELNAVRGERIDERHAILVDEPAELVLVAHRAAGSR